MNDTKGQRVAPRRGGWNGLGWTGLALRELEKSFSFHTQPGRRSLCCEVGQCGGGSLRKFLLTALVFLTEAGNPA